MKNSVKKILSLSLASIIALGLVGCGKKSDVVDEKNNSDKVEITEPLKVVTTSESYKELFDKFTSETGVKVEY